MQDQSWAHWRGTKMDTAQLVFFFFSFLINTKRAQLQKPDPIAGERSAKWSPLSRPIWIFVWESPLFDSIMLQSCWCLAPFARINLRQREPQSVIPRNLSTLSHQPKRTRNSHHQLNNARFAVFMANYHPTGNNNNGKVFQPSASPPS